MNSLLLAAAPFAPVDQDYLFEARQMQALSFAVHIPIVCFGIAFLHLRAPARGPLTSDRGEHAASF